MSETDNKQSLLNKGQILDYRPPAHAKEPPLVTFDRSELTLILALYGRQVAAGEWRDYAIDFGKERAVFSVFRRSTEVPLYRIEKNPSLARKQGAFSVGAQGGLILKRGPDLRQVLQVLEPKAKLVVL